MGFAAALATLPRQQRLCLALRYIDELSVAEVAAALGISDGAVKFHGTRPNRESRAYRRPLWSLIHFSKGAVQQIQVELFHGRAGAADRAERALVRDEDRGAEIVL